MGYHLITNKPSTVNDADVYKTRQLELLTLLMCNTNKLISCFVAKVLLMSRSSVMFHDERKKIIFRFVTKDSETMQSL